VNDVVEANFELWAHCSWKKWGLDEILNGEYERILLMDIDTMVRWDAPNIFEEYPNVELGAVIDQGEVYLQSDTFSKNKLLAIHYVNQWVKYEPRTIQQIGDYINAGVMLLTKEMYISITNLLKRYHQYWLSTENTGEKLPDLAEQTPVNMILWDEMKNITYLPTIWNDMVMATYRDASFINKSYVWHFTGPKMGGSNNKKSIMEQTYGIVEHKYYDNLGKLQMTRSEIINSFIEKYNYKSYLEIGLDVGTNYREVVIELKESVDPNQDGATYKITSDEFFKTHPNKKYDLIFIDGLHHSDQVDRDIINSINALNEDGVIILHDCNPTQKIHQDVPRRSGHWNGDVWKSIVKFIHAQGIDGYNCYVIDSDQGCGVIKREPTLVKSKLNLPKELTYEWFVTNRKEAINLISVEEFTNKLKDT
jgi:hypothetical protein